MQPYLIPDWPAPAHISAYTTLRNQHFNLADHVGDVREKVAANRALLTQELALPNEPIWLTQTHSTLAVPATVSNRQTPADASFTTMPKQVCVIMTADCLPILLCHRTGSHVAAIHAGWRGLAGGIIENTLDQMELPASEILAWLGPAIGPQHYEVGNDVRDAFLSTHPTATSAFLPSPAGRWLADLYSLARLRLNQYGVTQIYGGHFCTYSDPERFFSYRRDGQTTGRMATLIWINRSSR